MYFFCIFLQKNLVVSKKSSIFAQNLKIHNKFNITIMGCHSWFYKKVNPQPTREDKINQFIEQSTEWCKELEKALANNGFDWEDEDKWYPFKSKDKVQENLEKYKWMIDNAHHYEDYADFESVDDKTLSKEEQLYLDVEDWQAPSEDGDGYDSLTTHINGVYYSHVGKYYDIFRYNNYDTYVSSEDEMLDLLTSNNICISDDVKSKLKEFWTLYPDGLIYFG